LLALCGPTEADAAEETEKSWAGACEELWGKTRSSSSREDDIAMALSCNSISKQVGISSMKRIPQNPVLKP